MIVVTAFALLGWTGAGIAGGLNVSSVSAISATSTRAPSGPSSPVEAPAGAATVSTPTGSLPSEAALDAHALAATRAAGLKPDVVYLPRASATPAQLTAAREAGVVSSLYTSDPAPMGLAYYGTSGPGDGNNTGTILNTTTLQGFVDTNDIGIRGADLYQSVPDAFSIQLNAVLTNVTLENTGGYSFWAQAVATYYPATDLMLLVSNVWNFSAVGASVTNGTILSHGLFGTNDYPTLGYYYSSESIGYAVSYPFDLTLSLTSTLFNGSDAVVFGVDLSSPGDVFPTSSFSFDYVAFNSIAGYGFRILNSPSNFTADGLSLNPAGLPDDFELDIVGPGGGSQVDLSTADASLALSYFTGATYRSVPSAFSYGSDTAETSTGANIAWSNDEAEAPDGLATFGTMTTGPSILTGLWGMGAPEGSYPVAVDVDPANAFDFFNYSGAAGFSASFASQFDYAPDMATSIFYLMPGTYALLTELADHAQAEFTLDVDETINVTPTLYASMDFGLYTPLWAFSNAQVAAISQSGSGTPSDPYILDNNQGTEPLSSQFGLYNDRGFPVFPGVFLDGTTVSVELNDSASFLTDTSDLQAPGENLSPTNNLQFWFWNVSGVALNDSNITGWFAEDAYFPLAFNSFNVVFYASQHNLVSGNTFFTSSQALLMYASGQFFGPENPTGGNNTVWGNDFVQVSAPISCPAAPDCLAYLPYAQGLGLELGEYSDLIYNNQFDTPTTAWLLPLDLYTLAPTTFTGERWNITSEPAAEVNFAPGFPTIRLNGSVVANATQGGNSWWDYGVAANWANGADNPLDVLPYDENASTLLDPETGYGNPLPGYTCGTAAPAYYCASYIYGGGDYDPLATVAAAVLVAPQGLPSGVEWGAEISCAPPVSLGGGGAPSLVCCPPVSLGGGGAPPVSLGGGGGIPPGCDPPPRILALFETNSTRVNLVLPIGVYNWTPIVPKGYTSVAGGTFNVTVGPTIPVVVPYTPANHSVTFSERGLPSGLTWQVTLGGGSMSLRTDGGTDDLTFTEPNGAYAYAIAGVPGWQQATLPASGTVTVSGATVTEPTLVYSQVVYAVTFTESGLASGKSWSVTLGPTLQSSTAASIVFSEPNGTYSFTIGAASGYVANPSSGSVVVAGAGQSRAIAFTVPAISVTPAEGPVGATVTVAGTGFTGSTPLRSLVFDGVTISSCPVGSLTAGASGSFSCTLRVPTGTSGSTVTATNVGGQTATATFTVTTPKLTVSPGLGPVGATVTVAGTGFSVSSGVALVFDGVTISSCTVGSLTTGGTGAFGCTLRVPSGTSGTAVTATDAGGQKATGTFLVTTPVVAVVPGQGPVGAVVGLGGAGFSVSSTVTLVFDGVTISACEAGSLTTTSLGVFACVFQVPKGTSGTTVSVTDVGGQKASTAFTVTTPAISVTPSQGAVGATVTVSGTGFSVLSPVKLVFDGVTITSCTTGSLTTGASGGFSCTFKVPSHTSGTAVTATDVGGQVASTKFTVT